MLKSFAYCGNEQFIAAVAPRLKDAGYVRAEDVASADAVITFCTSQAALEELYFGEKGLIQEVDAHAVLIDLSATTPNFAREINAVATVSDLVMIEAPITVDNMAAVDAFSRDNLSCCVACEEGDFETARPLLEALCAQVHHVGGSGSAQLMRCAYTLQVAAQVIALIEANALFYAHRRSVTGVGAHMAPCMVSPQAATMYEAIQAEQFDGDFTVEMLMSGLTSAIMAADDVELILPQAEAAMHLMELLAVIGGADKTPAALSLVYGEETDCAKHGLDWARAEEAYGEGHSHGFGDGCDCGCGHDHDHNHGDYDDYDDFGFNDFDDGFGYSSN